jgi:hypothetical protein
MHHAAEPVTALPLGGHCDKGVNLAHQVTVWGIAAALPPLAGKGTAARGVFGEGRNGVTD